MAMVKGLPEAFLIAAAVLVAPPLTFAFSIRRHPPKTSVTSTSSGSGCGLASPRILGANARAPWTAPSATRYDPSETGPATGDGTDGDEGTGASRREKLKSDFAALLRAIVDGEAPEEEHPSLLAQNIETILNVIGDDQEGGKLLEEIIREDVRGREGRGTDSDGDDDVDDTATGSRLDRVSEAVDMMLSFAETFVEEAKRTDDVYKRVMGDIFRSIAPGNGADAPPATASATEDRLDDLLSREKEAFTPGFLRHVEGECDRIASLPKASPESARMLQILRLIQTRVLEELGKGIGEGAIVLGQLLGYDDEAERLAVLDAGLAVRGVEFAHELASLTEEALEGFEAVPGGADPELVGTVHAIDERIRRFIGNSDFQ